MDYRSIKAIAKDSLRIAEVDEEDGNVLFVFRHYPREMYEKPPRDASDANAMNEYISMGFRLMSTISESSFMYGKNKALDGISENELCHKIIEKTGCDNKTAFEISSSMREKVYMPFTHVIWTHSAKTAPLLFCAYIDMISGGNLTKEKFEEMVDSDAKIFALQRFPSSVKVPKEAFTGKRNAEPKVINDEEDENPITIK